MSSHTDQWGVWDAVFSEDKQCIYKLRTLKESADFWNPNAHDVSSGLISHFSEKYFQETVPEIFQIRDTPTSEGTIHLVVWHNPAAFKNTKLFGLGDGIFSHGDIPPSIDPRERMGLFLVRACNKTESFVGKEINRVALYHTFQGAIGRDGKAVGIHYPAILQRLLTPAQQQLPLEKQEQIAAKQVAVLIAHESMENRLPFVSWSAHDKRPEDIERKVWTETRSHFCEFLTGMALFGPINDFFPKRIECLGAVEPSLINNDPTNRHLDEAYWLGPWIALLSIAQAVQKLDPTFERRMQEDTHPLKMNSLKSLGDWDGRPFADQLQQFAVQRNIGQLSEFRRQCLEELQPFDHEFPLIKMRYGSDDFPEKDEDVVKVTPDDHINEQENTPRRECSRIGRV